MSKPHIFLGSSKKQFNPGTTALERLLELTREVDFAAFIFAPDDWTSTIPAESGQASPRDNVVFEAGLFGGTLGMRRTFILHAEGTKLPSDLLGLTCIRYAGTSPAEVRGINEKLRKAIENEGRAASIEGLWWQFSLTERSTREPSGIFYYWKGERPRNANAPQLDGTGEIRIESADRAAGYFTTHSDAQPKVNTRTSGIYLRAAEEDLTILDGLDDRQRAGSIAERLQHWKSILNA